MSCGHGICGSDGMRIDGICGLPCRKLVGGYKDEVLIEPLPVFPVIKDLVVDLAPFFERYRSMKPYLITRTPAPPRERIQSPEAQAVLADAVRCILCGCCTAACPVNQAEETADYTGPAALVRAFRYLFDSRDEGGQETDRSARYATRGMGLPDLVEMHGGLPQADPGHAPYRPHQGADT